MPQPAFVCHRAFVLFALLQTALLIAPAQKKPIAFTGARIIPVSGAEIPDGALVIQGGKIRAVGASASTAIPADAERVDAGGKVIMPGLIDSHSHIGGITTVNVLRGSGHLQSGQTLYLKLRDGNTIDDLLIRNVSRRRQFRFTIGGLGEGT